MDWYLKSLGLSCESYVAFFSPNFVNNAWLHITPFKGSYSTIGYCGTLIENDWPSSPTAGLCHHFQRFTTQFNNSKLSPGR